MRATPLERAENRWYRVVDNPSPIVKQVPTLVAAAIAGVMT
ncbi:MULTISPECIES: hypothetical protein [unclassified Microbacterium]|nr:MULTISPECIES: hypothetical protein [unclassified Microbacterium]MDH5133946.1 hypothetical protein [Microbacterium sp. RD10]MDH5137447.1 hypothetical protein [Microbacterium sp. RD11]MDH5145358.1 hypothetical protein [Microbacterium sp. RD12]MDH5155613.1 hypothetical protein [Microbacterium sp. RD06]MDH5166347.1 hypothetical protein [Microbacterium sp. RD02]